MSEYIYIELLKEFEKIKKENAALKEKKEKYLHFKGEEYTVLHDEVYDEATFPDSKPWTVYVGKKGIKFKRPTEEFNGYKKIKRFLKIEKKESSNPFKECCTCFYSKLGVYDAENKICKRCIKTYTGTEYFRKFQ